MRSPYLLGLCVALFATTAFAIDDYKLGAESMRQDGVPKGTVTQSKFKSEKAYPGTERDVWVYVPAQYNKEKPACLMVFQDGGTYVSENGQFRVPVVFDNLIHKKEMPVTIGVFISPGNIPSAVQDGKPRSNRSFEYDSLGDLYSKLLIEEVLPPIEAQYSISKTPEHRATCGISSGAICAWTVAWERPDQFRKVLSHIGSFTNIRGGHDCQALIRKTEKKPIKVFLQEGSNDLDNLHGNWPLANQQMVSSLKFKGYEHKFEMGDGGHSGKHGGAILPESLRWLWSDIPAQ